MRLRSVIVSRAKKAGFRPYRNARGPCPDSRGGQSIMGERGLRHVVKLILADLDILTNVAGIQSMEQLDRSWLES